MKKLAVTLVILIFASALAISEEAKLKTVKLPAPVLKGKMSLEEAIAARRSVRLFDEKHKIDLAGISQLAWSAMGVTHTVRDRNLRAAPSGGATYPIDIFIVTADGVYSYKPDKHEMVQVIDKDIRADLKKAALGQGFIETAPVSIVWCAVFERITQRYGERGIMYAHMEVGHSAENVHLQAVTMGLASVPVGAFDPEEVAKVLELPKDCIPLYIVPVGKELVR